MISIEKSLSITISDKEELRLLRDLLGLADGRLDEVDKPSWGDKLPKAREFSKRLQKILSDYERLGG